METPDARLAELIAELRNLLEEERGALLGGAPEAISAIAARKAAVAEKIEKATAIPGATRPDPAELAPVARYNQENGVICAIMLRHLSDAIDRLRPYHPHRSYKPDGSEETRSVPHPLGAA